MESPKAAHKSFKKKYRKMRASFNAVMRESDDLFHQMTQVQGTLRRMNLENARLLDVLVDVNESGHLPPQLHTRTGHPGQATPPHSKGEVQEDDYIPGATPPYIREASPILTDEESINQVQLKNQRNPMCALSWLRKYQPQVFLQELEEQKKADRAAMAKNADGAGRKRKSNAEEGEHRKKARSEHA